MPAAGNPTSAHKLNPTLSGFSCIRCHSEMPIADYFEGCPACLTAGKPSTVRSTYRRGPMTLADSSKPGIGRYAAWMPYTSWVTLGEGGTPCNSFPSLAEEL